MAHGLVIISFGGPCAFRKRVDRASAPESEFEATVKSRRYASGWIFPRIALLGERGGLKFEPLHPEFPRRGERRTSHEQGAGEQQRAEQQEAVHVEMRSIRN